MSRRRLRHDEAHCRVEGVKSQQGSQSSSLCDSADPSICDLLLTLRLDLATLLTF